MCNFLLVGIPKAEPIPTHEAGNLGFIPIDSSKLPRSFPATMNAFFVVSGGCSCDLYTPPKASVEDRAASYRKKGWSEGKVRRAIEQASHSSRGQAGPGLRPDVRALLASWCSRFHTLAFAYFVTGGDPVLDIPATLARASITDVVNDRFEPPTSSILLLSN